MLNALIIAFITFVLWKLTPIVFDMWVKHTQFQADEWRKRLKREHKQAEEDATALSKAQAELKEHTKRMEESISHGGRVQYPWVSGIRTNLDSETNKDFINVRGELAKRDHEAQRRRGVADDTTLEDLYRKRLKKLYEEEGP